MNADPERHHFERPTNWFNQALRNTLSKLPTHEITQSEVEDLRANTARIFGKLVLNSEALEEACNLPNWYIADEPCPPEVLSGEVTLDENGKNPHVRYFNDAPVMHVPGKSRREVSLLSATDHFMGHLYAHYAGYKEHGEDAAVFWQNRAAQERYRNGDRRFMLKPILNMSGYNLHKGLWLTRYSPEISKLPSKGRLSVDLERDLLTHEGLHDWEITLSQSRQPLTEISTYYRRILPDDIDNEKVLGEINEMLEIINTEKVSYGALIKPFHDKRMIIVIKMDDTKPSRKDKDILRIVEARISGQY